MLEPGVPAAVRVRRTLVMVVHLTLWTASLFLAFLLRFDGRIPDAYLELFEAWLPLLLAARAFTFYRWRLFRGMWRYTGAKDLTGILTATTVASLAVGVALVLGFQTFPRSILAIEWLAAITLVGGMRFAIRWVRVGLLPHDSREIRRVRILVVGAGDAGEMLLRGIQQRHAAQFEVVGFVDDDGSKIGAHIHGVRVLGTCDDIPGITAARDVEEVVIAVPSASGAQMRRIVDLCKTAQVRFKTIPGLDRIIDGRATVTQLRDVDIEDLLGREPVQLDMDAIAAQMEGHVVMVTGAGGSIGAEISRQVCRFAPSRVVLVERAENNLFQIHRELAAVHPEIPLEPCVADVGDVPRMRALFARHRPTVVFHAAAHKHVPMMEWNPGEALKNNVLGTRALADLADEHGVERFVMISTDKAVNPTSVMGASKRVAEIYVQALSQRSRTKFVTVRFGNVLGSAGSVIPIFKEQIARGGPVTVTHPEMKRYFMTIPEASQLVLQAGVMGDGGEIFILDMGEPVRIADLARDLITLSGLKPGEDVEIRFVGVRPGEKLFEELSVHTENAGRTKHPKIFVGRFRPSSWEAVVGQLDELAAAVGDAPEAIRARLAGIVPEFAPGPGAAPSAGSAEGERWVATR